MSISDFFDDDVKKVEKLIEDHPTQLTPAEVAEFLGVSTASVRAAVQSGAFGLSWRLEGKLNRGYHIPTAQFLRWYLNKAGWAV